MIVRLAVLGTLGYLGYLLYNRSSQAQIRSTRFRPGGAISGDAPLQSIPVAEPSDYVMPITGSEEVDGRPGVDGETVHPERQATGTAASPQG